MIAFTYSTYCKLNSALSVLKWAYEILLYSQDPDKPGQTEAELGPFLLLRYAQFLPAYMTSA